ncbi:MAG: signal peptidase II [Polyangiaceae bacterium]
MSEEHPSNAPTESPQGGAAPETPPTIDDVPIADPPSVERGAPPPSALPAAVGSDAPSPPTPAEGPRSTLAVVHERPSLLLFWIITIVSTVADLATKEWATKTLAGFDATTGRPKSMTIIKGLLEFQHAQNPGGAFSMLRSLPEIARRPFFLLVSTVASVFIASIYPRIDRRQWAMKIGLPLALGGAVGNLVDRMRHGMVVDFIHAYYQKHNWPTFNVADIWIVAGVALMAIDVVASRKLRAELMRAHDAREPAPSGQPSSTSP